MKEQSLENTPIKIGISTCLLGEKVRFDAGHKKDRYLTDVLGNYFEWVPVCPELEVGMGVPRESVRLVGSTDAPRMVGTKSGTDWTDRMVKYSSERIHKLRGLNLSGYIFKSDSPSCGMERVRVYADNGMPSKTGVGLFTGMFIKEFPIIPVEEEGRLNDSKLRDNFIVRVFSYHRLQMLFGDGFNRGSLVNFHTVHKYLLLSHSPKHYELLGRIVANAKKYSPVDLREKYCTLFMEGLSIKSTTKKNVNVLHHILGFLREEITVMERDDILRIIDDYYHELVPLIVPITLIKHYVMKRNVPYIRDQVYLNPHPKELMLRNHV
jgi:uncharacterized protein YbgA (DUF1722 family)/uncharacterized protein YbbK (DUF523 family)